MGGRGCAGGRGINGGKWDNCNNIIKKIYFLKRCIYGDSPRHTHMPVGTLNVLSEEIQ